MAKKILIVEDDRFLRELMSRKLASEGFEVIEAEDGEEGMKKMRETKPDLILLDLILPEMDGFEVLARKAEDEEIKKIPVVVLSNLGQREDIEKALSLGAIDYIVKANMAPKEIIEKIALILK